MTQIFQSKDYKEWRMIDFLEDCDFRNWILDAEKCSNSESWKNVVQEHEAAAQARYVLLSLKSYFDQNSLTEEAIQLRVDEEINKYRHLSTSSQRRRKRIVWISRSAAAILLILGMFFLLQWVNRPLEVYTTGYGEQMTIKLPDGSDIQLNSNSTLIWDRNWEKTKVRFVHLEGEAFFKVMNLNNHPFRVGTDDITVNVTGTQFNVNSRRQKTMVFLAEGKVNVTVQSQPDKRYVMEPGEKLVYRDAMDKVVQQKVKHAEEISGWKEGLLIFREEPLARVLESISDIYGKEFLIQDSAVLDRTITTTIPLTNWEISLKAIQLAMKLEVEQVNDTIRIMDRK